MRQLRQAKRYRRKPEMLTAYDDDMNEIGTFPRPYVHAEAMWHRVCQCWIVGQGKYGPCVYLQRRSFEKRSNPGRYDISAGGHISAGEEPAVAMVREIREETGLRLSVRDLNYVGEFPEIMGNDKELASIYVYYETTPMFSPGNEVIYMVSADLEDLKALSEGKADKILVTPAIRTGLLRDETFSVDYERFCNHKSFLELVYPFIMDRMKEVHKII